MVIALIKKIISMYLMMLAAVAAVKAGVVKSSESRTVSTIILYIVIPCMVLSAFKVDSTPEVRSGLMLAFIGSAIIEVLMVLITALLKKPLRLTGVEIASADYSNSGNLIIPLVSAALGPEWVIYTCAYSCVQLFLIWSHGKYVLSGEPGFDIKKVLLNVNMLSVFAGLLIFIFHIRFPGPIQDAIDTLGNMIGPLSMVGLGLVIGGMDFKKVFSYKRVWLIVALRLIVLPLVCMPILLLLSSMSGLADGKTVMLITFMAAASCSAAMITQLAQVFGSDEEYAAAINVTSTLLCVLTLPAMVALFRAL